MGGECGDATVCVRALACVYVCVCVCARTQLGENSPYMAVFVNTLRCRRCAIASPRRCIDGPTWKTYGRQGGPCASPPFGMCARDDPSRVYAFHFAIDVDRLLNIAGELTSD